MKMKQIYVFRHGQTDWNKEGRIQGHLEVPLNDLGRLQAERLRAPLARLKVQAVLSSDLGRAVETAEIACAGIIPVHRDPRLREIHLGKLQGLSRDEIVGLFGEEFSHRLRHSPLSDADMVSLGSESGPQVLDRATQALAEFFGKHDFDRIGLSTHGGVIRWLLQSALGEGTFPPPVPNSAVFPILFNPSTRLCELQNHVPI